MAIIPNAGQDVEKRISYVAGGCVKWYTSTLKNLLAVFKKVKHIKLTL